MTTANGVGRPLTASLNAPGLFWFILLGLPGAALYRFATLTAQGIAVTPEFGSCSDIATATLEKTPDGAPEPQVRMAGSRDPIAALGETAPAPERMQLRRFALRNGAVEVIPATD